MSSLVWEGSCQLMLIWIWYPRWHRMCFSNTYSSTFWPRWNGRRFVHSYWYKFYFVGDMGGVWSTHVEIHFVSSLTWDRFLQHMLRYTLCLRMHGSCLVNARWNAFSVLTHVGEIFFKICWYIFCGMICVWSTQVEIHIVYLLAWEVFFPYKLAWEGFGKHILRYLSFPHWQGRGLFNTSWNIFCVLACMGRFWAT